MTNPSTVYANIFVDELIRSGLKHVCFVPGSRHTPLILAFARYKDKINIYSHLDERSASFFALGLALASDEPVAIVCTSGSAGANFFPAIVEAHQSRVPLIVLTADRPHELRQSGANQTIDQVKMFGDFVLWFYDAPLPEENPPAVALRNLRTLAARTYARAKGIRKGVVHINMPFRKPLEPDAESYENKLLDEDNKPHTTITKGHSNNKEAVLKIALIAHLNRNGVIICGPNFAKSEIGSSIFELSQATGYPIIADSTSGGRFHYVTSTLKFGGYDSFLNFPNEVLASVDVLFRFGDVPTSNVLNQWLNSLNLKHNILFSESGEWLDDNHVVTDLMEVDVDTLGSSVSDAMKAMNNDPAIQVISQKSGVLRQSKESIISLLKSYEEATWDTIDHEIETGAYFDGAVVYDVVDLIPGGSTLFAGNSLPVRHLDQFGKPTNKRIFAYASRGASGIDGNISTALGAGAARPDKPLVAIVGDITFYHDMNGLLAVHRCGVPVTIVLLNNDGGGIFHRLPISKFDPDFTDYFITAHGLDYSHSAKLYGLDYIRADTRDAFRQAFTESVTNRTSTIIEVRTDAQADLKRRNEIVSAVHARLKELKL